MIDLYSKPNCPYCENAKAWLNNAGIAYTILDITTDPAHREFVVSRGHKTVPQIYLRGEVLVEGGYSGLLATTPAAVKALIEARS